MIGIPSSDKKPRLKKDGTPRKQPKKGADRKPKEFYCHVGKHAAPSLGARRFEGELMCAACLSKRVRKAFRQRLQSSGSKRSKSYPI